MVATLCGMWNLHSQTRNQNSCPPFWELRALPTGPPGMVHMEQVVPSRDQDEHTYTETLT